MRTRGKRIRLMFQLVIMAILLCGCWDRTETNDIAFVLTSSVDLDNNGLIRVSYLLPLPGQMGGASGGGGGTSGGKSYYIDSEVGKNTREATYLLQKRIPRRLFLAHRRTVVIGEDFAKHGIQSLFDSIPRLPESRLTTNLVVAKGKGYDLLNAQPKFERFSAEAIRELAKPPLTIPLSIKDVGLALSFGSDPVMAYMETIKSQKGKKPSQEVHLLGLAQFRGDKMVGSYADDAAAGIAWLSNKVMDQTITFALEDNNEISIRIIEGERKITPTLQNGQVTFHIDSEMIGKVREDSSEQDLNQSPTLHKVEKEFAAYVKKNMQTAIKQMQQAKTDSAQLGLLVWRKYPYEWEHGLEANWPELFSKATFEIKSEAFITETGLINQNVLKGEKK
jgi:spore germination protein KC